jgi:PAS domain S-box-containing protein
MEVKDMVKKSARVRSPVKNKKRSSSNKNRKSEEQLKQNQSFLTAGIGASTGGLEAFKTLAENAPDVIFRVDRNLRFIFVNKKISDLTGIPKEQFYGKTLLDLGLQRDICIYLGKKAQEVFDSQTHTEFEFSFSTPEGLQWFHARIVPEFDIHGDIQTVLGIAHDITDLKRTELAYKEERAFRDSMMSSLRIGIAAVDLEGRQSYVNRSFCEIVGWSKEELEGAKPPFVYWPPEEIENINQAFQQVLSGKEFSGGIELRFRRRNGERFDALVLFSSLRDDQGNIIGWIRSIGDITEQKKKDKELQKLNRELEQRVIERTAELDAANKRLQESEQKACLQLAELETIYDSAPVGLCVFDPQLTYFRINKRLAEINGVPAEDHIGHTPWEVVPDLAEQAEFMLRRIIETGQPVLNVEVSGETRAQPGVHRTWLEHWLPLKAAEGHVIGINVVAEEITERKRMEESLLKSEEILRAFFNMGNLHNSILELKEDDIVYKLPNRKTVDFFGLSVEEMTGKSLKDLGVPEQGIRFWVDQFRRSQKTRESMTFEYPLPYKGKKPWFQCSLSPIQVGKEQSSLFSFVAIEITDRKQSEHLSNALNFINLEINSRLEFDEIMQAIVTEAGKAIGCETAAISLKRDDHWILSYVYGLPRELVGIEMLDEEEPHAVLAIRTKEPVIIQDAYNDERVNPEHMKKYGVRSVLVVPILVGDNPIGVIFFNYHTSPVTFSPIQVDFCLKLGSSVSFAVQNAQLLKELKDRARELENANKELEAFTYSVSHDLKAPLIVANGFCKRLSEFYSEKLDDRGARYLQRIKESCQHMNLLIGDLLNLSKVTTSKIKLQSIDLTGLVKSIATQLRETQPKREVSFVIEGGLTAKGDSRLLRIALENLLGNAWKFTSKSKRAKIEFGLMKTIGGKPTYFVRDNGSGFDMSMADRLFMPFQRLHGDEEFSGTGIGLATVHRIITRHGGRMWAESAVGKGATFFFTLLS